MTRDVSVEGMKRARNPLRVVGLGLAIGDRIRCEIGTLDPIVYRPRSRCVLSSKKRRLAGGLSLPRQIKPLARIDQIRLADEIAVGAIDPHEIQPAAVMAQRDPPQLVAWVCGQLLCDEKWQANWHPCG